MVNNQGNVIDYPDLSSKQRLCVINKVLTVLNDHAKTNACNDVKVKLVNANINKYLTASCCSGRTIVTIFPDFIVRSLLQKYGAKLIDHLSLENKDVQDEKN